MARALLGIMFVLTIACSPSMKSFSVRDILKLPNRYDGRIIQVQGVISPRHGILNLFTKNKQQCLGLILKPSERAKLIEHSERKISLSGTFQAEGCGRDAICDEHLCGPGVLTNVSLIAKEPPAR